MKKQFRLYKEDYKKEDQNALSHEMNIVMQLES
jgi:hypothetical protein